MLPERDELKKKRAFYSAQFLAADRHLSNMQGACGAA
jgi:hypothetical protein